jgi:hypothetical protein
LTASPRAGNLPGMTSKPTKKATLAAAASAAAPAKAPQAAAAAAPTKIDPDTIDLTYRPLGGPEREEITEPTRPPGGPDGLQISPKRIGDGVLYHDLTSQGCMLILAVVTAVRSATELDLCCFAPGCNPRPESAINQGATDKPNRWSALP